MDFLINNWWEVAQAALLLLTTVAALTPTEWDDTVAGRLRNLLDKLRGPGGKAFVLAGLIFLAGCAGTPEERAARQQALVDEVNRLQAAGVDIVDLSPEARAQALLACEAPTWAWIAGMIDQPTYEALTAGDFCARLVTAVADE